MSDQDNDLIESDLDTLDVDDLDLQDDTDSDTNDDAQNEPANDSLDAAKVQEQNKRLFERAKKAEAELKRLKAEPVKAVTNVNVSSADAKPINSTNPQADTLSRDEAVLIAQGMDLTAIEKAKQVQTATGKTLLDAVEDELFKPWHQNHVAEIRKSKARELGASKGSGTTPGNGITPGMSTEDHKAFVKDKIGL